MQTLQLGIGENFLFTLVEKLKQFQPLRQILHLYTYWIGIYSVLIPLTLLTLAFS